MMEVCDNCQIFIGRFWSGGIVPLAFAEAGDEGHLCRASESTCVDGKDCPDYVENCACTECWEGENDGTSEVQQ